MFETHRAPLFGGCTRVCKDGRDSCARWQYLCFFERPTDKGPTLPYRGHQMQDVSRRRARPISLEHTKCNVRDSEGIAFWATQVYMDGRDYCTRKTGIIALERHRTTQTDTDILIVVLPDPCGQRGTHTRSDQSRLRQ